MLYTMIGAFYNIPATARAAPSRPPMAGTAIAVAAAEEVAEDAEEAAAEVAEDAPDEADEAPEEAAEEALFSAELAAEINEEAELLIWLTSDDSDDFAEPVAVDSTEEMEESTLERSAVAEARPEEMFDWRDEISEETVPERTVKLPALEVMDAMPELPSEATLAAPEVASEATLAAPEVATEATLEAPDPATDAAEVMSERIEDARSVDWVAARTLKPDRRTNE